MVSERRAARGKGLLWGLFDDTFAAPCAAGVNQSIDLFCLFAWPFSSFDLTSRK